MEQSIDTYTAFVFGGTDFKDKTQSLRNVETQQLSALAVRGCTAQARWC